MLYLVREKTVRFFSVGQHSRIIGIPRMTRTLPRRYFLAARCLFQSYWIPRKRRFWVIMWAWDQQGKVDRELRLNGWSFLWIALRSLIHAKKIPKKELWRSCMHMALGECRSLRTESSVTYWRTWQRSRLSRFLGCSRGCRKINKTERKIDLDVPCLARMYYNLVDKWHCL